MRIYDFGESNGRYFLVMEYIEGRTIGTLISEHGPMPPATAVRLLRQVALGLEHAHRKGLIHRDVNPYNVLVTHDGTAKLADLGLAIDLAEEDRVTREGATVGTFDYVAPEQARHSHSADIRSDIYSLGCTLYHMLSGHVPFPSPSLPEKLFSHQALEPAPLDRLIPGLPEGLAEVVQRMMRKSPDERYATPIQVSQALEPFEDEYTGVGNREGAAPPLQNPSVDLVPRTLAPRSDGAASRLEAASALALVKTGVTTVATKLSPGTAIDSCSGFDAFDPNAPLLSPVNGFTETESQVPLVLDLGPASLLSERLAGSKTRSISENFLSAATTAVSADLRRFWLWGPVALTVTVMVLAVILAIANPPTANPSGSALQRPALPGQNTEAHPKPPNVPSSRPNWSAPIPEAGPAIVVRMEGQTETAFSNLLDAMQTAMRRRGSWIELRNREPLRLASDQTFDLFSGSGSLIVRAARGIEPVLEVELKGTKPLFATGSGVSLELSGLTLVVHYPPSGQTRTFAPSAVITAAGKAKIERCAFKVTGSPHVKDSRAIFSNGGALEVDRCWFEDFDTAIEVSAINRTVTRIQQTMIVLAVEAAQAQPVELYGWGVKVQYVGSGSPAPHLMLAHCTIEGAGLLDLSGGSGSAPLQIDVNHCAVRAKALVACKPGEPLARRFIWHGQGNQYDILGRSWIVPSARQGTSETAVTGLNSWLCVAIKDSEPVRSKLKYHTDPTARSTALRPRDFTIDAPHPHPGADPGKVGPWSDP